MRRIFLIACGKSKLDRQAPARQLYTGALFRKSLAYAEAELGERDRNPQGSCTILRSDGVVYVLSAEHHLVDLDQVLDPYDVTLSDNTARERRQWGERVAQMLDERGLFRPHVVLVVLAGKLYFSALSQGIGRVGMANRGRSNPCFSLPLAGLGLGERLAWLTDQLQMRRCRVCGCTDYDCRRCIERTGEPCHWVGEDLCSACEGEG